MKISLPELSLVVLMGASGSGKSTFARRHFLPTEVISSDHCRGLVSDDENSMEATESAFAVLHFIAAERLKRGKLTVIDATNVQKESRASLLALAKKYHCLAVVIALDTPEKLCHERNAARPDRDFGPHVVRRHCSAFRRSLRSLSKEGFRYVHVLSQQEAGDVAIERQPLWNNRKSDHGPFDIIGDVHGCADELELLLRKLGYVQDGYNWQHPQGRRVIFVGDLVDRGPRVVDALQISMAMCDAGNALCVPGNHDVKFLHYLQGRRVKIQHGLEQTISQIESTFSETEQKEFKEKVIHFLDGLISHYVLDDGNLVVAHAGLKEELQGRASGAVRAFALFGDTTGETDDDGLPVRLDWAKDYRGKASVVYGHTPVLTPSWVNHTINIDSGCVFGGALTALRWPERQLESVPAAQTYAVPARALGNVSDGRDEDVLDITDVCGKRIIETRLMSKITIREENATAALEVMSRFAAPPQWLIYLPPTMSPCATSTLPGTLEHPAQAFDYFREHNVEQVICEEKHMGSRAVIIVCRDVASAQKRFRTDEDRCGILLTRTGRPFFSQGNFETEILSRLQQAIEKADLWNALETDWMCIDAELMPWSIKARELIRQQYAPVAVAAQAALRAANDTLQQAAQSGLDVGNLQEKYQHRQEMIARYERVTRLYNWEVDSVADLRLAAFHLLASEGQVHIDKNHLWHLAQLNKLVEADTSKVLFPTVHRVVQLDGGTGEQAATDWWEEITAAGSEGMVVKPLDFIAPGKSLLQPAVKCRGREYLRLIYGPEYDEPEQLKTLRNRGLSHKRSMAAREFALGIEALERFVNGEPLHRVHECAFAVLAMESEPVDPRL